MYKLKVKDIKELIKNLPDDTDFEIDISDNKVGQRLKSTDIRYRHQVEMGMGKLNNKKHKLAWLNIVIN
jgi:hypothetical protein